MCLGLGNGCVPNEEKKTSLLKPYTNFENIKDMDIDKMAESLAIVEVNAVCCYISMGKEEYNHFKSERKKQWLEYLESEVE